MILLTIALFILTVDTGYAIFGYNGYSEYRPGDLQSQLIIVSPHGGAISPSNITDRTDGCYEVGGVGCVWEHDCGTPNEDMCRASTVNDFYTQELSGLIVEEVTKLTGIRPHHVMNHLHRSKLDANRDIHEAAMGNPDAERAWADFHGFVEEAQSQVADGQGLVLDIHGHAHENDWIELGYLFSTSELDGDEELDPEDSSINHLSGTVSVEFEELLRGASSFGGLLEHLEYYVVPGPEHPGPDGDSYFSGGYITQRHGSRDSGTVDAIQIESPRFLRDEETSPEYAVNLAVVIRDYMEEFIRQSPLSGSANSESANRGSANSGSAMSNILLSLVEVFFG